MADGLLGQRVRVMTIASDRNLEAAQTKLRHWLEQGVMAALQMGEHTQPLHALLELAHVR